MKVMFLYPDIRGKRYGYGHFHRGIGVLSACLKNAGHKTELFHIIDKDISEKNVCQKIIQSEAEVVGISVTEVVADFAQKIIETIKKNFPNMIIVIGGVHATLCPEKVIAWSGVDYVCIGEADECLVKLINQLETCRPTEIDNFWVKTTNGVVKNRVRILSKSLDEIPIPDRSIFDFPKLFLERKGITTILASRGCPYFCNYCNNQAMNKCFPRKVEFRSVRHVINEIKEVIKNFPQIKMIHFDDDILPLYIDWFREFAHTYKQEIKLPFVCSVRPNLVSDEVASLFKMAGCYQVRMGTENGNDYLRNTILGRNLSSEQLIQAFGIIRKYGVKMYSNNIIGSPEETASTIIETIKLNASFDPEFCLVSFCYPFIGTEIERYALERNLIRPDKATDFFDKPSIKVEVPDWQLYFFKLYFRHLVKIYKAVNWIDKKNPWGFVIIKWIDKKLEKPKSTKPIIKLLASLGQYINLKHRNIARDYLKIS